MGWAGGSKIMSKIITAIKQNVSDVEKRKEIYIPIINAMEDSDWDTQDECFGEDEAFDSAMKELHPSWFEENE